MVFPETVSFRNPKVKVPYCISPFGGFRIMEDNDGQGKTSGMTKKHLPLGS